jgi:O-antigen biosynthesis protein WbqV
MFALAAFLIAVALTGVPSGQSFAQALLNTWPAALSYAILALSFDVLFRADRSAWRFTSLADAFAVVRNATLAALCLLLLIFIAERAIDLPRSTLVLAWLLDIALTAGARLVRRAVHEHTLLPSLSPFGAIVATSEGRVPLLLVGPVDKAETYLRDAARDPDQRYRPVGVVSLSAADRDRVVRGVPVLGDVSRLGDILDALPGGAASIDSALFLCDPAETPGLRAEDIGRLKAARAHLLRPSRITEMGDDAEAQRLVRIGVEELLARPAVKLDVTDIRRLVSGKRILVTGAGGSIGSEISRQVAALGATHLTLLDVSEFALFNIDREIALAHPRLSRRDVLCDVRNAERLRAWAVSERPDLVFHAAALKHVTLVENHPCEGVLTNIVGTWNVAEAARAAGAQRMVFISTDKAVGPTCVMGATKRLAETVVQTHRERASKTRFSVVRFGNVLGSAGSVVPIFKEQIERGGPVTVTHPDVERFFMTIPEAVQLVLHAVANCDAASDGRSGVYVLDMGKPVRILDLARRMIELHGLTPDRDIPIVFTGLKPGEKMTETLVDAGESARRCGPGVVEVLRRGAAPSLSWTQLLSLEAIARRGDPDDVRASVFEILERLRDDDNRTRRAEERPAAVFAAQ